MIYIIHAPIDIKYADSCSHFAPSLALISLKTYLQVNTTYTIKCIDGTIFSLDNILSSIEIDKPLIVCVSVQLLSYTNALVICDKAKKLGCTTVLGGHHATQIASLILQNQASIVDFVISGDGEIALKSIIENCQRSDIPNITYASKDGKDIVTNKRIDLNLEYLPLPVYDDISWEPYDENLRKYQYGGSIKRYARVYSHKGCNYRDLKRRCLFCGRADNNVRRKSPNKYWEEIWHLHNNYKVDYIFDVGDDFLSDKYWLEEAVRVKNRDYSKLNIGIGIFGRADEITSQVADMLRRIDVTDVTIGFESGDNKVLKKSLKEVPLCKNLHATKILAENGITVTPSYVLGLPGENHNALTRTYENACKVIDITFKYAHKMPFEIVANLLEPLPGSPAFDLIKKKYHDKYFNEDKLELAEVQKDYYTFIHNLKSLEEYIAFRSMLVTYGNKINNLVNFADPQGWLADELIRRF